MKEDALLVLLMYKCGFHKIYFGYFCVGFECVCTSIMLTSAKNLIFTLLILNQRQEDYGVTQLWVLISNKTDTVVFLTENESVTGPFCYLAFTGYHNFLNPKHEDCRATLGISDIWPLPGTLTF